MNRELAALVLAAGLSLGLAQPAGAQHGRHHAAPQAQPHGSHAPSAAALAGGEFEVVSYGAFRAMVQRQDYSAKVRLGTAADKGATEAVGAVSGLRGEITMIGGKLLVSYGAPCASCPQAKDEYAALLATARVAGWQDPVALPADLAGEALDAFVIERARLAGLDVTRPFPVRLEGVLTGVKMHVLRAPNPGFSGHGSAHPMADQEDILADRLKGTVVGIYAPPSHQGVVTHPGEAFHFHWVDQARTRTAHLDAFGMARGASLLLPRRAANPR